MAEPVQSTSSDSINKLRQFRLQKKAAHSSHLQGSILDAQVENICPLPISAGKDQGVYLVPDLPDPDVEGPSLSSDGVDDVEEKNGHYAGAPESFLQVIFTDGSQSTKTSSTDQSTQLYPVAMNEIKREIDSDPESMTTRPAKRKKRESAYCDVLKERERSLKLMMDTFPHSDIMEMQDILLFADWDVEQAIAFVNEHPPSESKIKKTAAQSYSKMYKDSTECAQGPVLESEEIGTDGWLATPNKVTLKTYSKNTAERKIVLPNTKPLVFYGTKERAKVKRQVEAFLRRQRLKLYSEYETNQFELDYEANQLEVDSEPEAAEPVEESAEIKTEN